MRDEIQTELKNNYADQLRVKITQEVETKVTREVTDRVRLDEKKKYETQLNQTLNYVKSESNDHLKKLQQECSLKQSEITEQKSRVLIAEEELSHSRLQLNELEKKIQVHRHNEDNLNQRILELQK